MGETSAARTAPLDKAQATSVMPRCASVFMGVVTLVVQPNEQIERVVAGSVAHGALMTLKKEISGISPETWKNGLTRCRDYLASASTAFTPHAYVSLPMPMAIALIKLS